MLRIRSVSGSNSRQLHSSEVQNDMSLVIIYIVRLKNEIILKSSLSGSKPALGTRFVFAFRCC